jgi:type II secretory pathway component GspD/PulD (secretin)
MNRILYISRILAVLSAAAWACGGQGMTWAQSLAAASGATPPEAVKEPPGVMERYTLRYAEPVTVASVAQAMFEEKGEKGENARFAVDPRTNTLLVRGSPQIQQKVADLIKKLDVPPGPAKPPELIKVFTLVNADPASVAKALKAIGPQDIRLATYERSGALIAAGPADSLNVAEALASKLDERISRPHNPYEIRVVWLASGLTGENKGAPPADDLKGVVAELSRHGVHDPRHVGQIIVQSSTNGNFAVESSPRFGDQATEFSVSGSLSPASDDALTVQIRVSTRTPPPNRQSLNEVNTQVVLPDKKLREKQFVVLATAPIGNQTSVFVLQVTGGGQGGDKK